MSIVLDQSLRECISHEQEEFPITYFCDELATLPQRTGPLHWHPEFEIAAARRHALDFQIGLQHIILQPGECIFINGNVLHAIRQAEPGEAEPMPNIVFSGALVAAENSAIYRKYIHPIACCDSVPYIVFRRVGGWQDEVNRLVCSIYRRMQEQRPCYELAVQRELSSVLELIYTHWDEAPRCEAYRVQFNARLRLHRMLSFIHERYAEHISLSDIAAAAHVSRSEAGRCFKAFMGCSPVEALIRYRLQRAHRCLTDTSRTLQEISDACGFNSVNYFSRQFRRVYGCAPGQVRSLGK